MKQLFYLLTIGLLGLSLGACPGSKGDGGSADPDGDSTPAVLGSESNPYLATAEANAFTGSEGADWVSYADSDEGVEITLAEDGIVSAEGVGGFAAGDTLTDINNLIGSNYADTLTGNGNDNTLRGGVGGDTLDGGDGTADEASYSNSANGVRVNLLATGGLQADFEANSYGFTANDNEAVGDTLSNIENILGSGYDDWLTGDDDPNRLLGGAGDDRLEGGADADTLNGGAGADTLNGGAGDDTLDGGAGDDTYLFGAGDGTDTITDDGGAIVFLQGTGDDYATATTTYTFTRSDAGRGDAVTLTVTTSPDGGTTTTTLNVLEFASDPSSTFTFSTRDSEGNLEAIDPASLVVPDKLTAGNAGSDGSEENPFLATAAADSFTGSGDNDWVSYENLAGVIIDLSTRTDLASINNLIGSDGIDDFTGNGNANILRGEAGDDTLEGGVGADMLDGGDNGAGADGGDEASYRNSASGVRVSLLLQGQQQQDFDGTHGFTVNDNEAVDDILTNIENIRGSDYDDWLTGDGDPNRLIGGAGNDILEGGADTDTYLFGAGDGTDTITDDGGAIVFLQGTGDDYATATTTYTFTRSDAGRGDAVTLTVTTSTDGGTTTTTLNVLEFASDPSSTFTFSTRSGSTDTAIDSSSLVVPDKLIAGSEGNPFMATAASDGFMGSAGLDWVSYENLAGVIIDLSTRTDLASINNLIGSDTAGDTFTGNGNANTLRGGAGDFTDTLSGGAGNDILEGGAGADMLDGGAGADTLEGGEGDDTYLFNANDGTDTITDDGSKIVFLQGTGNAYDGAIYIFTYVNGNVRFRVLIPGGGISNTIDFTTYPSAYTFYTRSGDTDTEIDASSISVPDLQDGSESNPYKATAAADILMADSAVGEDWLSYVASTAGEGVTIDLGTLVDGAATGSGGWAAGDKLTGFNNLIGTREGDRLTGNDAANTLRGHAEDDYLYGGAGNDNLYGDEGIDNLFGNDGDDTLYGGADNDTLEGGAGADTLDGGDGIDDWASYSNSALGVRVNLDATVWLQVDFDGTHGLNANNNEAVGDSISNTENIRGSDHKDWLTGDTNANRLEGGAGDDTLEGGANEDTYLFNNGDGTDTILAANDGVDNKLIFRSTSGTNYVHADFVFARGTLAADGLSFTPATTAGNNDLRIVVKGDPNDATVFDNTVYIKGYFATGNVEAYTIYRNVEGDPNELLGIPETTEATP